MVCQNIHKQGGAVLEFGLGNGRTFDHMRKLLPERDIAAHPDCIPHPAFQFIGDFRDSIPRTIEQLGRSAALAHLDIGTGQKNTSLALASKIAPCMEKLLCANAIVVSDQEVERWRSYKLQSPSGISENRIHLHRL